MTQDAYPHDQAKHASTELAALPPRSKRHRRRKLKPLDWLSELNLPVRGEMALWVAVITQAMMDALSNAKTSEARFHKHEATNWLTGNSKNFITVCHHAGLDPDYVRRKAKRALASPRRWRAEPGKGSRYHERRARRLEQSAVKSDSPADIDKVILGPWGLR